MSTTDWTWHETMSTWGPWEPSYFYLRNGHGEGFPFGARWLRDWLGRVDSEEHVARLAAAGVNAIIGHYWKGFGLEAEAPHREALRAKIAACHTHGIRYYAYVQFLTLANETMLRERPDSADWIRIRYDGTPADYGPGWRPEPCTAREEFIEYVEEAIRRAIAEDGADGIMLDNFCIHPCICEHCTKAFREFVRESPRFTPEALDLPYIDYDHVEIPRTSQPRDPLVREWHRFRLERLLAIASRLRDVVHAQRADALFMPNFSGVHADDARYMGQLALDARWAGRVDALKDDGAAYPVRRADGTFLGSMDRWKLCRKFNIPLFSKAGIGGYRPDAVSPAAAAHDLWRLPAAALAFGQMPPAANGLNRADRSSRGRVLGLDHEAVAQASADAAAFAHRWSDLFAGATPYAELYLYRSPASFDFVGKQTVAAMRAAVQECLRDKAPFEFAFAADLADLPAETVLVIPDMLCLGDDEVAAIADYHARGGRVVVLGPSGWCDDDFQERSELTLAALAASDRDRVTWDRGGPVRGPRLFVEPTPRADLGYRLAQPDFDPARRDALRLVEVADALLEGRRKLVVRGDADVVVNATRAADGRLLVHAVNLSAGPRTIEDLQVRWAGAAGAARFVHDAEAQPADVPAEGQTFRLPPFEHYGILILPATASV